MMMVMMKTTMGGNAEDMLLPFLLIGCCPRHHDGRDPSIRRRPWPTVLDVTLPGMRNMSGQTGQPICLFRLSITIDDSGGDGDGHGSDCYCRCCRWRW